MPSTAHELALLADALAQASREGSPTSLATIVRTSGSTYRRPGARLLVLRDGRAVGMISGGCLEPQIIRKAEWLTREGPCLATYDSGEEDSGFGMWCRGSVTLLLEPVAPEHAASLARWLDPRGPSPGVVALEADEGGSPRATMPADALPTGHPAHEALARARREGAPVPFELGAMRGLADPLCLPIHLAIFGAGEDAVPLARLARVLGWGVSVVVGREGQAQRDRFAGLAVPRTLADFHPARARLACVVMTHHGEQDVACVQRCLELGAPFIALLGPTRRRDEVIEHLDAAWRARAREIVRGPAGLGLGGEGPEAIALAIAAQVHAEFHAGDARPLCSTARSADGPEPASPAGVSLSRCEEGGP